MRQGDLLLLVRDFSSWLCFVCSGEKITYIFTPFAFRLLEELGSDLCKPVGVHRCREGAGGLQEGECSLTPLEACRRFHLFSFKCLFST